MRNLYVERKNSLLGKYPIAICFKYIEMQRKALLASRQPERKHGSCLIQENDFRESVRSHEKCGLRILSSEKWPRASENIYSKAREKNTQACLAKLGEMERRESVLCGPSPFTLLSIATHHPCLYKLWYCLAETKDRQLIPHTKFSLKCSSRFILSTAVHVSSFFFCSLLLLSLLHFHPPTLYHFPFEL